MNGYSSNGTKGKVTLTRLDRLARSTRDLLNILDTITKAGAGFKSLTDTWADTTTAHGRLMLTVLGGLAEFKQSSGCSVMENVYQMIRKAAGEPCG
jgi:DNA invertase Pin-like site-specific DNA recombinase